MNENIFVPVYVLERFWKYTGDHFHLSIIRQGSYFILTVLQPQVNNFIGCDMQDQVRVVSFDFWGRMMCMSSLSQLVMPGRMVAVRIRLQCGMSRYLFVVTYAMLYISNLKWNKPC